MKILLTLFVLLFSSSVVAGEKTFIDRLEFAIKNEIQDIKRKIQSYHFVRGIVLSATFGASVIIVMTVARYSDRRKKNKKNNK